MRVPRRSLGAVVVAAIVAALVTTVAAHGRDRAAAPTAVSWLGLVGEPRAPVPNGERMIVVLNTPSVAQRIAKVRYATEAQERAWRASAYAAQEQVLLRLAAEGASVKPDFSYSMVLDGFSAALDGRAVALLEQMPEVQGIYPVRAAYPAALSSTLLRTAAYGAASGHRPAAELPGYDGHGVTIALLDTGVDEAQPYLRGHLLPGLDLVGGGATAGARTNPQDPAQVERHGTELAGILVGAGGPGGLHGVAPGATVLPLRVAGWQPAADGGELVYGRSDQLIAGLERAVDPNGDGDAHDAVRVAVVGVAEPYAAFTDGLEARAVQGALALNTLVVAPAGNDGAAGPAFVSITVPAAAPAALAVGATDARTALPSVRVVLRRGLDVIYDRTVPLLGAVEPQRALTLQAATPRSTTGLAGTNPADFFDTRGDSLVAGRAAVVPIGADPEQAAVAASRAGAAAVLLYGGSLPAGAMPLAEDETAPVVVVPAAAAAELLAARRAGISTGVAIGPVQSVRNPAQGFAAGFSSRGLAFDSGAKPDLAARGVAVATAEPGTAPDGSPLYGTVNGTSAAAATGGAAALLAEMRPALDGPSLESLLVGYAQPAPASPLQVGAGTLRLGASAVGEVAAQPATLGFGVWQGPRWHSTRTLVLRNVSTRRLEISVDAVAGQNSEALHFSISPNLLTLRVGQAKRVQVTVTAPAPPGVDAVTGVIEIAPDGSETLRVPWALDFERTTPPLLAHLTLSESAFKPSDSAPALLSLQAGTLLAAGGLQIEPVSRLDILLYDAGGRFLGVLARLRDLLPGSYSFGITGRGPNSIRLAPGRYELRLAAWPVLPATAKPSRAQVSFRIE